MMFFLAGRNVALGLRVLTGTQTARLALPQSNLPLDLRVLTGIFFLCRIGCEFNDLFDAA
mgnify:CR=1 FL=1